MKDKEGIFSFETSGAQRYHQNKNGGSDRQGIQNVKNVFIHDLMQSVLTSSSSIDEQK